MMYQDFKDWLEENSNYKLFVTKATEYQEDKNKKRAPAKRWNESKIARAVNEMWKNTVTNAYQMIRKEKGIPRINGKQIWLEFIEENNFLEMFNEGIAEMSFD